MRGLLDFFTKRRSVVRASASTRNGPFFSRACGEVVPIRGNGLPSPNSAAAELVRFFVAEHIESGAIREIAQEEGRDPARFYRENEGANALSWDWVDRGGARLSLEDRLALGRFLMDRWGLRVEVGPLPGIGG